MFKIVDKEHKEKIERIARAFSLYYEKSENYWKEFIEMAEVSLKVIKENE